jgi:group I intron endonuclease
MKYGVIYKITSKINNKAYVGQTIQAPIKRFNAHYREVRHGMAITIAMQRDGKDNFTLEILAEAQNQAELNQLETYFIETQNTLSPNGYNLCGGGGKKNQISEETRLKLSVSHLGHTQNRGRKHTKASRLNYSRSVGGKPIVGINLKTGETQRFDFINQTQDFGFNQADVRSVLRGVRKQCKGFTFVYEETILNNANQSGSTESNSSEHAPRLEGETAIAEYNPSTSLLLPINYRNKYSTDELVEAYKELRSITLVAKRFNMNRTTVSVRFKRHGIKVEKLA